MSSYHEHQQLWINPPTDKRTELAVKKVPFPTPAHKIFDGLKKPQSRKNNSKSKHGGIHAKYRKSRKKKKKR